MAKRLESCGKAVEERLPEAPTGDYDGRCALDLGSDTSPTSRHHKLAHQRALSGSPATKFAREGASSGTSAKKLTQHGLSPT